MALWGYEDTIRKLQKELDECKKYISLDKPRKILIEVTKVRREILNAKSHWEYLNAMERFRKMELHN